MPDHPMIDLDEDEKPGNTDADSIMEDSDTYVQ
jgi:hypothetical protein